MATDATSDPLFAVATGIVGDAAVRRESLAYDQVMDGYDSDDNYIVPSLKGFADLTRGGQTNRRKMSRTGILLENSKILVVIDDDAKKTLISPRSGALAAAAAAVQPGHYSPEPDGEDDWRFSPLDPATDKPGLPWENLKQKLALQAAGSTLRQTFDAFLPNIANANGKTYDCLELRGGQVDLEVSASGGKFNATADAATDTMVPIVGTFNGKYSVAGNAVLLACLFDRNLRKEMEKLELAPSTATCAGSYYFTRKSTLHHLVKNAPKATADYIGDTFDSIWTCSARCLVSQPSTRPNPAQPIRTAADDFFDFIRNDLALMRFVDVYPPPRMLALFDDKLELHKVVGRFMLPGAVIRSKPDDTWKTVYTACIPRLVAHDSVGPIYTKANLLERDLCYKRLQGCGAGTSVLRLTFVPDTGHADDRAAAFDAGAFTIAVHNIEGQLLHMEPGCNSTVYKLEPFLAERHAGLHRLTGACTRSGRYTFTEQFIVRRYRNEQGRHKLKYPRLQKGRTRSTNGVDGLVCLKAEEVMAAIEEFYGSLSWLAKGYCHLLVTMDFFLPDKLSRVVLTNVELSSNTDVLLRDMDHDVPQACLEEMAHSLSEFYKSRTGNWPA